MQTCLAQGATPTSWPQEIESPEGKIVVYQPQPESLEGNILTGRAAISVEAPGGGEPIFGAMWMSAVLDTDLDDRTAVLRDVKVTKVAWPGSTDAKEQRFTLAVEQAAANSLFEFSLDQLAESLADAEIEQHSLEQLKTDPPEVVFRDQLAVLLLYEGEPRFSPIENSNYERIMNTPLGVARNKTTKICYLTSGVLWYQATNPLGPWKVITSPPEDLKQMVPEADASEVAPKVAPSIVVATQPTELICTDGTPDWRTVAGGKLLYVRNTETAWLRDLSTNNMYVLISGRWYRSKSKDGPWTFVRPDELPESFSEIPPDSDIGGVRTSVAGTEEAEDAMLDAQIPQTATISRSTAKLDVAYDGEPKFESIAGTSVAYAVNTNIQVLEIAGRYYAVDDGVWYSATTANGPWAVADSIPQEEINKIPPSAPVYNTTYVHIYESTPTHVTVGYLPGYMWSYPYYGVPVYGTGWYYPPYWGRYYYPRPVTYGMHVGYNPWTGWNFGMSWSNGFMSVGVSWGGGYPYHRHGGGCGGYYGGGYRRPVVINTGDINIGNSVNVGNRVNVSNRIRSSSSGQRYTGSASGSAANRRMPDRSFTGPNIYNRPENRDRNAPAAVSRGHMQTARPSPSRQNNVYSDRNGTVSRPTTNGWEKRDSSGWSPQTNPDRTRELDRSQQSRQSGTRRATPSRQGSPSRPGGGRARNP